MKKFLCLLGVATLSLSLAACGGTGNKDNQGGGQSTVTEEEGTDGAEEDGMEEGTDGAEDGMEDGSADGMEEGGEAEEGFAEGQSGEGPKTIFNSLFSVDVPEGLTYDLYSWYTSEDDDKFGTYVIDIGETDSYGKGVRLTVTTQRMIDSLEGAAEECKRMNDFSGSKETIPGEDVVINGVTYKTMHIVGEKDDDKLFYVTYFDNHNETEKSGDVYVEIRSTEASMFSVLPMSNELVQEFINSLVLIQ